MPQPAYTGIVVLFSASNSYDMIPIPKPTCPGKVIYHQIVADFVYAFSFFLTTWCENNFKNLKVGINGVWGRGVQKYKILDSELALRFFP